MPTDTHIYRQLLEQQLASLTSPSRSAIEIVRDPDPIVDAELAFERQTAATLFNRNARAIRQIRAALDRLANGSFGVCAICSAPIPEKRLLAAPAAERCICCEERSERRAA